MRVTIKDIAQQAEVSVSTVSRVLNDRPDVSQLTKERVLEVANKLGYTPNSIARGLVMNRTYTLGLIIPDISNPFFPEVAKGIDDIAKSAGYSVIMYNTDINIEEEEKAVKIMMGKQVDGILLALSSPNSQIIESLSDQKFPVVQIVRSNTLKYPSVDIDGRKSAYQALNYLYQQGHRKIAHITGYLKSTSAQAVLKGYNDFVDEKGLNVSKNWVLEGGYTIESGYIEMKRLLSLKDRPTAVFAANDLMAIGAYKAIEEQGLQIPDDISIIGHDNIELASYINPGLTTMSFSKNNLGRLAADLLIKQIENSAADYQYQDVVLETELIERNSVKSIR